MYIYTPTALMMCQVVHQLVQRQFEEQSWPPSKESVPVSPWKAKGTNRPLGQFLLAAKEL